MFNDYATVIFPVITVFCLFLYFAYYHRVCQPLAGTTEWITRIVNPPKFTMTFRRHPMDRRDILPVVVITLICAFLGFFKLGDTTAPLSFHRFIAKSSSVVVELDEPAKISGLMYYTGLWTGHYTLDFSSDGVNWATQQPRGDHVFAMNQDYANVFKWLKADINDNNTETKYIRITASDAPMELGEIALYDQSGKLLPKSEISCKDAPQLFDEQNVVPASPTYMNSMYFDEIYHARTAYENLNNIPPYETTHPPLGKLIIAVGVWMLGMTPFGWRFMGTLFGVIMVPIFYVLVKNMFGKRPIAVCGTLLFAFDFMRFVQTRIATIDTYGVIFILISYFFMYRYITQEPDTPFNKTIPPLALSGLFFGIGCACKWIVIYAGVGLLALYIIAQVIRAKYYKENELPGYAGFLINTLVCSALFFVTVPAVIYCLSYIPIGMAAGMTLKGGMLWNPKYYQMIWDSQLFMYHYHSTLVATHAYSSPWYSWLVDARPILYYSDTSMGHGMKSAFAAFGNPIVWWGGFLAIIAMVVRFVKDRDGQALFILIGYLSQLVPWMLVSRIVFIYHYFPSTIFLALALAHVMNTIWERKQGRYKMAVYGFAASAVFLFVAFYPVLSGLTVPRFYTTHFLRWIPPSWPF